MITVCLCTMLQNEYPKLPVESQTPFKSGVNVQEIVEYLGISDKDIGVIVVNGLSVLPSYSLKDGDKIELHPFVMGG